MFKWNIENINYLINNYKTKSNKEIANILNCNERTVLDKKTVLGLTKKYTGENLIVIKGNICEIITQRKDETFKILFDRDKLELVKSFNKWYVNKRGYVQSDKRNGKDKRLRYLLHRVVTNCPEDMMVDHINGNKLDNRLENLRICIKQQNSYNIHNFKSEHRLVYSLGKGKDGYRVQIKYGKYNIYLKQYKISEYEQACQDAKYLLAYVDPGCNIGRTILQSDIPQWIKDKVDNKIFKAA